MPIEASRHRETLSSHQNLSTHHRRTNERIYKRKSETDRLTIRMIIKGVCIGRALCACIFERKEQEAIRNKLHPDKLLSNRKQISTRPPETHLIGPESPHPRTDSTASESRGNPLHIEMGSEFLKEMTRSEVKDYFRWKRRLQKEKKTSEGKKNFRRKKVKAELRKCGKTAIFDINPVKSIEICRLP